MEKKTRLQNLQTASAEEVARLIVKSGMFDEFCNKKNCPYWSLEIDDCPFATENKEDACIKACTNWLNSVPEEK